MTAGIKKLAVVVVGTLGLGMAVEGSITTQVTDGASRLELANTVMVRTERGVRAMRVRVKLAEAAQFGRPASQAAGPAVVEENLKNWNE